MKALILSGGSGTRLRPITHTSSKQLVPVANKPILFYAIEHMVEAGITEIGMIVGDTEPEIRAAVGDGSRFGVEVTYLRQTAPLGLAHCVLIARDFLADDDFVMYAGDNLLREGITRFVDSFERARRTERVDAQILLAKVPDPHRFGVAELSPEGEVVRLVEKPKNPPSDLALVGVYLFDPAIHEAVRSIRPSPRGELEITDAIQWMVSNGKAVRSEVVDGYWKDLGELPALLDGNNLMLESLDFEHLGDIDKASSVDARVRVEAGARIVNSTVRGPVVIGAGTVVTDSFIGPFTAVGDGCEIVGSEIEHSMLLAGCKLDGVGRITDSLLGRDVTVRRSEVRPQAMRLMIGDHSKVEVS